MIGRVHFGALDAEARWREGPAPLPAVPDSAAERIVAVMEEMLFALCAPGDALLTARPLLAAHRQHLEDAGWRFQAFSADDELHPLRGARAEPYAVTAEVLETCRRLELEAAHLPPVEVAREVGSKLFSNALAASLGLPGVAKVTRDAAGLASEAGALLGHGGCVVKDPLGVSGRGSMVIREEPELRRLVAWLQRRAEPFELLVQPLFRRAEDFSCHLDTDGEVVGLQVMENDGLRFGAVRSAPLALRESLERANYFEVMAQVSGALRQRGYRGPACVDSMRLADGSLVPLLEINARRSMGLINLAIAARAGMPSRLSTRPVRLEREVGVEQVLEALDRAGVLARRGRGGLLLLSGRALAGGGTRGRLCVAALGEAAVPEGAVAGALAPLGIASGRAADA